MRHGAVEGGARVRLPEVLWQAVELLSSSHIYYNIVADNSESRESRVGRDA